MRQKPKVKYSGDMRDWKEIKSIVLKRLNANTLSIACVFRLVHSLKIASHVSKQHKDSDMNPTGVNGPGAISTGNDVI